MSKNLPEKKKSGPFAVGRALLDHYVITPAVFVLMVLIAVLIYAIITPFFSWVLPPKKQLAYMKACGLEDEDFCASTIIVESVLLLLACRYYLFGCILWLPLLYVAGFEAITVSARMYIAKNYKELTGNQELPSIGPIYHFLLLVYAKGEKLALEQAEKEKPAQEEEQQEEAPELPEEDADL